MGFEFHEGETIISNFGYGIVQLSQNINPEKLETKARGKEIITHAFETLRKRNLELFMKRRFGVMKLRHKILEKLVEILPRQGLFR